MKGERLKYTPNVSDITREPLHVFVMIIFLAEELPSFFSQIVKVFPVQYMMKFIHCNCHIHSTFTNIYFTRVLKKVKMNISAAKLWQQELISKQTKPPYPATWYPVRKWALKGIKMLKSENKRNREWNCWMPVNA